MSNNKTDLIFTIVLFILMIFAIGVYFFKTPEPYILDIDMSTDVDDVCAVRIATQLSHDKEIDLKAVMYCVSSKDDLNIKALRGLLVYDDCKNVKIGRSSLYIEDISPYWDVLAEYSDGNNESEDAVKLYRKILASSKKKVNIVTTGYLTNIELLLKSEPDEISNLSGMELVKRKCKQLYITGGAQPEGFDNNFFFRQSAIDAIKYVNDNFPMPIIYFPSNVGGKLICGNEIQQIDINREDVVTKALDEFGTTNGRAAWDPFAMWAASYKLKPSTELGLKKIDMIIHDDGSNLIVDNIEGRHFAVFLLSDDLEKYNKKLDDIVTKKYKESH